MPAYVETFILDVDRFIEHAKGNTRVAVIEGIQDINEEIVARSPVITGMLRGSWFAAIGQIPGGMGAIGGDSTYRLNVVAQALELGQTFVAANTTAYARRVELGFVGQDSLGRNYNQRGRFFVQSVMNEASRIATEAAIRVANGQAGGARLGGGGATPLMGYTS